MSSKRPKKNLGDSETNIGSHQHFLLKKTFKTRLGISIRKIVDKKKWVKSLALVFLRLLKSRPTSICRTQEMNLVKTKKNSAPPIYLSPTLQPKLGISPRNWHNSSVLQILLQLLSWRWKELRVPAKILIPGLTGVAEAVVRGVGKPLKIQNHRVLRHGTVREPLGRSVSTPYIPSGKHTKSYGKSPFLMGKSTINGHFQ